MPNNTQWKHNVFILAATAAFAGGVVPAVIAMGGLLGQDYAPSPWLATLPVASHMIGIASSSYFAANFMQRYGRRAGFITGCSIGMLGLAIAALAVILTNFWLLCLAFLATGSQASFVLQTRFAASEGVPDSFRPQAISLVMSGGVLAAIIGPQSVIHGQKLVSGIGPFIVLGVCVLITITLLTRLKLPLPTKTQLDETGRSLRQIARQPLFIVAVVVASLSHSLMSLVMTASPLAVHHAGHSNDISSLGIQWHVMAMYLPSFITGTLISRFGVLRIMSIGVALLLLSVTVAIQGFTVAQFWSALILLGLGWNFAFIGATTLLTTQHRPEERGRVQGFNDSCVFALAVVASLASGAIVTSIGWHNLQLVVYPFLVGMLFMLLWGTYHKAKQKRAAPTV